MDILNITRKSLILGVVVVGAVLVAAFFAIRAICRLLGRAFRSVRNPIDISGAEGTEEPSEVHPILKADGTVEWLLRDADGELQMISQRVASELGYVPAPGDELQLLEEAWKR